MISKILTILYEGSDVLVNIFGAPLLTILLGTFMSVTMHNTAQLVLVYSTSNFKKSKIYRCAILAHYTAWYFILKSNMYNETFLDYLICASIICFVIVNNIIDLRNVFDIDKLQRTNNLFFNAFYALLALISGLAMSSRIIFGLARLVFGLLLKMLS